MAVKQKLKGFAAMSPARRKAVARKGAAACAARGTRHRFTAAEVKRGGEVGGQAIARDREHMRAIGKKGAQQTHARRQASSTAD